MHCDACRVMTAMDVYRHNNICKEQLRINHDEDPPITKVQLCQSTFTMYYNNSNTTL